MDNKGRNFLHVAVQNSDIESVLFLISVQANVNSRVQDSAKLSPLHLAVQAGSEIIVRNLVKQRLFLFYEIFFKSKTKTHICVFSDVCVDCSSWLELK